MNTSLPSACPGGLFQSRAIKTENEIEGPLDFKPMSLL